MTSFGVRSEYSRLLDSLNDFVRGEKRIVPVSAPSYPATPSLIPRRVEHDGLVASFLSFPHKELQVSCSKGTETDCFSHPSRSLPQSRNTFGRPYILLANFLLNLSKTHHYSPDKYVGYLPLCHIPPSEDLSHLIPLIIPTLG
jgi:hypothetical protein